MLRNLWTPVAQLPESFHVSVFFILSIIIIAAIVIGINIIVANIINDTNTTLFYCLVKIEPSTAGTPSQLKPAEYNQKS